MTQYALKDIAPNPFRHIRRYPIRRDKVAALRESFRTTGFWGNIVARKNNGKPEIAYGHHRLVALKEEYGPNYKIDLIVRDLSDEAMLQMMARENMEEWGTSAAVEHETIRAVVEAYAAGKIELPAPDPTANKSQLRYAPSFIPGEPAPQGEAHPYTAQSLGQFLGWLKPSGRTQDKVTAGLTALQFIQEKLLEESDFEGLTTKQAEAVIAEARQARARRDAAAHVHRQQAEQAAKEAAEAEKRRKTAERARLEQQAMAAQARDAEQRRRAQEEVHRLAEERKQAEAERRLAEKRREKEQQREQHQRQEGRKQASAVGRGVSQQLKAGKIGYKQAPEVASRIEGKRGGPPPDIDDFSRRLTTELTTILDPDRDPRSKRIQLLIQFREDLAGHLRSDLARALESVAARATTYARQLTGANPAVTGKPSLPSGGRR